MNRFLVSSICLIVAACAASSARVVKTYELEGAAGTAFSRVLVVGAHRDHSIRRQFEDTLADALRSSQTDAVASIGVMPSGHRLDENTVAAAAEAAKADAVLVTRLAHVETSARLEEGRTTAEARRKEDGHLVDFFRYDYVEYEDPMNVAAVSTVAVNSDLYRVADHAKLWSAESTAVDKQNALEVIQSVASATARRLRQDGFVR